MAPLLELWEPINLESQCLRVGELVHWVKVLEVQ